MCFIYIPISPIISIDLLERRYWIVYLIITHGNTVTVRDTHLRNTCDKSIVIITTRYVLYRRTK